MLGIAQITRRLISDLKGQGFKGDVIVTFNAMVPTKVPTLESFLGGSWTIEIVPKWVRK